MDLHRLYVGALGLGLSAFVVTGCGNVVNPGSGVSVSVELSPSFDSEILSDSYFGAKSASGLVQNNFCYFFNVTGSGLFDPAVDIEEDKCGYGPKGKGKTFGPFAYGENAELVLDPGLGRQFDLIGFKIPDGTNVDCKGVLAFAPYKRQVPGTNVVEKRVKITYDKVVINPEVSDDKMPVPQKSLFIFQRSAPTDIISGAQTVSMRPISWMNGYANGNTVSLPQRYDCKEYVPAKIEFREPTENGAEMTELVIESINEISGSKIVKLKNSGTVTASEIKLSFQVGKVGFDTRKNLADAVKEGRISDPCPIYKNNEDNRSPFNLQGGKSCNIRVHFYPPSGGALNVSYADKLELGYEDGNKDEQGVPVVVAEDLGIDAVRKDSDLTMNSELVFEFNAGIQLTHYKTILVTNSGRADAVVSTATLTGNNRVSFKYDNFASSTDCDDEALKPAETCEISVKFVQTYDMTSDEGTPLELSYNNSRSTTIMVRTKNKTVVNQ